MAPNPPTMDRLSALSMQSCSSEVVKAARCRRLALLTTPTHPTHPMHRAHVNTVQAMPPGTRNRCTKATHAEALFALLALANGELNSDSHGDSLQMMQQGVPPRISTYLWASRPLALIRAGLGSGDLAFGWACGAGLVGQHHPQRSSHELTGHSISGGRITPGRARDRYSPVGNPG